MTQLSRAPVRVPINPKTGEDHRENLPLMSIEPDLNRRWWDERAALHGQDSFYDTAGFLQGRSTLHRLDHELAGGVTGRALIHLQCHTDMDTLSWLRAGAARRPADPRHHRADRHTGTPRITQKGPLWTKF